MLEESGISITCSQKYKLLFGRLIPNICLDVYIMLLSIRYCYFACKVRVKSIFSVFIRISKYAFSMHFADKTGGSDNICC